MEHFRLAEIACEGGMFRIRDVLVWKHQDQMLHPDVVLIMERCRV